MGIACESADDPPARVRRKAKGRKAKGSGVSVLGQSVSCFSHWKCRFAFHGCMAVGHVVR